MKKFSLYSPGGNITALVEDATPAHDRARLARAIMEQDPAVEQVGFVSAGAENTCVLEMMGSELCINAAHAAGMWWKETRHESSADITGSGIGLRMSAQEGGVSLEIPRSILIGAEKTGAGYVIDLAGIRCIVSTQPLLFAASQELFSTHRKDSIPAIALIHASGYAPSFSIDPLVWVAATDTTVRESACGSGSIAACIAAAKETGVERFAVTQPSGAVFEITIPARNGTISVTCPVAKVGEGLVDEKF